jgi:hypothetical protein
MTGGEEGVNSGGIMVYVCRVGGTYTTFIRWMASFSCQLVNCFVFSLEFCGHVFDDPGN